LARVPSALSWVRVALLASLAACSGRNDAPPRATGQGARTTAAAAALSPAHYAFQRHTAPRPRVVPGEYLVRFRPGALASDAARVLGGASFRVKRSFASVPGLHHVVALPGVEPTAAARALARRPDVQYVEPNFIVTASNTPDDPMFPQLWAMHNTGQYVAGTVLPDIGALAAWDLTTGDASVVIAVIDSGIDYNHQDLAANIWVNSVECNTNGLDNDGDGYVNDCHGINAITGSGDPMDDFFHGTHVSGTIGAVGNNAVGVTGVNWNVTLLACKFLDSEGNGTTADAVTCLDYVALKKDAGINIVASNNSWGGTPYSQALSDAIVAQRTRGILFVAAAGNDSFDNDQLPTYPCSYDLSNIICVASAYDALSSFSNYGTGTVHVAAPGQGILSTVPNNAYDTYDGTSMATPHVTGLVALLKAQDPTRDWRALKNLVLAGAVPPVQGTLATLTSGRIYAPNSMNCSNSVVEARMRPALFEPITLAVGGTLALEAININCANPNGNVVVNVAPSGDTVTLVDDGTGNDEVAGDGIYSGTWTATAPGTYTLTFPGRAGDVVNVVVDPLLKPGFPARMTIAADGDGIVRPPLVPLIVGNIDGGTGVDILSPGYGEGPLYAWKSDGTSVPGWPNYNVTSTAQVTLGTFQSGSAALGVAASFLVNGLELYNGDGSAIPGWPEPYGGTFLYPVPTVDVDGDGVDEIINTPALRANGTLLNPNLAIPVVPPSNQELPGPTVIADLDADGSPDFILANNANVWASNVQGLLAGFPMPTPGGAVSSVYPVVGDVDGDGKPEIILPTSYYVGGDPYIAINILSNTGQLLRTIQTTQLAPSQIATLADLDGDGIPEILLGSGAQVYAWKGDGTPVPGWPVSAGTNVSVSPVVVGDVAGNGEPDVVFVSIDTNFNGSLWAVDAHGVTLPGFPKALPSPMLAVSSPAIADLDGTGHNVIVVSRASDMGLRDNIFVYDLKGPGPYGPIEWGQYMNDASHRGYYQTGKNLPNDAYLTAQSHGAGTIASADGAINCGATCIHLYPKGTNVQLTATASQGATFSGWLGPCAGQSNPCRVTVSSYTAIAADFASPITLTVTGQGSVTSTPAGLNCPSGACRATFPARTQVTLTAAATSGSAFNGWSGDCAGTASTCGVVIDGTKSVTAQFQGANVLSLTVTGAGSATITSSPSGINCGATCSANFTAGAQVTLTAVPAAGSYVSSWSLPGCAALSNTCTVTMTADTSATINLALEPVLAVSLTGAGSATITSSPPGINCAPNCSASFTPGAPVTLTAVPASSSYVSSWGLPGCAAASSSCALTMNANTSTTINLALKPVLTVSVAGSGQGSVSSSDGNLGCPGSCTDAVVPGTSVTITASPAAGSTFSGWSGACSGTQVACALTVNDAASATATFTLNPSTGSGGKGGGGGAIDLLTLLGIAGALATQRRRWDRARGLAAG